MTPIPIKIGDILQLTDCGSICGEVKEIIPGQIMPIYHHWFNENGVRIIECIGSEIGDCTIKLSMIPHAEH